ncbi:hypothetical protein FIBSPDRAFT_271443 [Athelia psychrophila]|uniref:Uncharacterized protein n=1 Tax=Athelia psychrophila TaxID=1759441 RepID=A0A165WUS3_9AGAM|nr:hypothetical protein FIBSPDRAFT_271443 [Fibularhizoctonia sp. CBS 109695]
MSPYTTMIGLQTALILILLTSKQILLHKHQNRAWLSGWFSWIPDPHDKGPKLAKS